MQDLCPGVEKKLEAVIKTLKEQFPDLSSASISELMVHIVRVELS